MSGYCLKTIPVELKVKDHRDEDHVVVHHLRPITAPRYLDYQKRIAAADAMPPSQKAESGLVWLEAKLDMWKESVVSVDGYEIEAGTDFLEVVPPQHRVKAVDAGFFHEELREEKERRRELLEMVAKKRVEMEEKAATLQDGISTTPSSGSENPTVPEGTDAGS